EVRAEVMDDTESSDASSGHTSGSEYVPSNSPSRESSDYEPTKSTCEEETQKRESMNED
ncbi:target of EGR1 protein 1, partial [Clarias magur]